MDLNRMAIELEETVRLSGEMVAELNDGLAMLLADMNPIEAAKNPAIKTMIMAMQMQDRIEQRCAGIKAAADAMAPKAGTGADVQVVHAETCDEACDPWSTLALDELRKPGTSGIRNGAADIELF
jgi:hypothetical protein